jgi:hypothetical protein
VRGVGAGLSAVLAVLSGAVPGLARADSAWTLEEVGALAPGVRSFTHSPLLELTGVPAGVGSIDPTPPGSRGGEFDVLDVGNITLVAGPWTYPTLAGADVIGTLNAFLGAHENEYDFVSIFLSERIQFGAYYSPLQNDVVGLGAPPGTPETFDSTTDSGYGELEGYLFMNSIFDYLGSVRDALFFGQEVGHRWGAYARRSGGGRDMLGRSDAHWSFFLESQNSTMEGNAWREVEPGVFETDHMGEVGYSQLDMYLMGFRPPEQVDDWFLIGDPVIESNPVGWPTDRDSPPYYAIRAQASEEEAAALPPIRARGQRIDIGLKDVVAALGPRDPAWDEAQREFRMAFVVMMPSSSAITFDQYLVAEDIAEELAALWEDLVDGEATLSGELGTSGIYGFTPAGFPPGPVFEPAFDPDTETGVPGGGCAARLGPELPRAGWGWACGLVAVAAAGRRRRTTRRP